MINSYEQVVDICSSVSACFSYVSWSGVVKPRLDEQKYFLPYEYGAIQISCLSSSLISIRKFDDFFKNIKSSHDDVTASDFGYGSHSILTNRERKEINKGVAHFTIYMDQSFSWNIDDLLVRMSGPIREFLQFLANRCDEEEQAKYFEISETIRFLNSSIELINS